MLRFGGALCALGLLIATPAVAAPVDMALATRPSSDPATAVPACDDAGVLSTIQSRFAAAEINKSRLAINGFDRTRERRFVVNRPSPVARRYCHARTTLSDGKQPTVHYLIERGAGFAGYGWNVEFCVAGKDRWHVYDGRCRTASSY